MRKATIFVFAVLLLAPFVANGTESAANDSTRTWTAIRNGLTNTGVNTVAVDRTNPNILYAGTNDGLFKSTDWGENWSAINNGLTNTKVWALAIDPSNTDILFVGTSGGAFKSTNGGGNWSAISGLASSSVWALAIDPSNTSIVYAGCDDFLFKSTDGGARWNPLNVSGVDAVAIDPSNPNTIYANTQSGGGIYKSSDGGNSWPYITNGLDCLTGYAVAVDPMTPNTVYAANLCGVYKSTNGGGLWVAVLVTAPYGSLAVAIDPTNPSVIYAGTWGLGVFKSTDGGKIWSVMNSGLGNPLVTSLAIDPTNPSIMYAATYLGVYKSSPDGTFSLHVSTTGTGDGEVTSDPPGIDCGSACAASYDQGTSVTLTATPSTGSTFEGWSGPCSGTGDCTVTMDGNQLVTATFNVPGQVGVHISIDPGSLSFGTVNVGQSSTRTITITNQTNSTGTLTGSVGTLSAPFSVVSGGGAFSLVPGQSVIAAVQFSPTAAGIATASLAVTHNATNESNPFDVPLSGTGVGTGSALSVSPSDQNYGDVKVSKSKTASFKVTNTGKGDIKILYSRIKGQDPSMFAITSGRGSKTLAPGKSMTIKAAFKPTSTGSKSAILEITSNDSVAPVVNVPLSGTGL